MLAVGGWADAYVDAIFRMLERLSCPRRALVGPWGHQWPQEGRPGPAIGFLQEAVRWWDHWLKGIDNGVMDEPMLRAWMQESVAPQTDYAERPGRWVAEPAWPPADDSLEPLRLDLDERGLRADVRGAARRQAELRHCSPQTVGLDAGAWCAYGNPADLPADQRRDDALSLSLDSAPLSQRIELLGRPAVRLLVASDRPDAFVVARLCDVAPGRKLDADHPRRAQPLPSLGPRSAARARAGCRGRCRAPAQERRVRGAGRAPATARDLDQLLAVAVALTGAGDAHDLDWPLQRAAPAGAHTARAGRGASPRSSRLSARRRWRSSACASAHRSSS